MSDNALYVIRDAQGNIYGPAPLSVVRQWVRENRIAPEMEITAQGAEEWRPARDHPDLHDLWQQASYAAPTAPAGGSGAGSPATPAASVNPYEQTYAPAGATVYDVPKTSGMAIAALVCGIIGVVPVCGAPVGLAGIICGILALARIGQSGGRLTGRGMAIWGIALGAAGILMCCGWGIFATMLHPAAGGPPGR